MPSERAFGGMNERKSRAGFERGENGLKVTRTSVRNLVIMAATGKWWAGEAIFNVSISAREKVLLLTCDGYDKIRCD
jgi:hypothetical protein